MAARLAQRRGRSGPASGGVAARLALPDFPWDLLEPAKAVAAAHPGGLVDLSMGTPVDPVPPFVRAALAGAADSPGYPLTTGTPALRSAIEAWVRRTCGATGPFGVLPTIGSKELVASLPALLGLDPGDEVVIPPVCYPTYEVGAILAGCTVVRSDSPGPRTRLIWVNSPGNPDGRVLSAARLRDVVERARAVGAVVASDECYLPLAPGTASVLGDDNTGVLAVHSLSKRSNLAGYRAGFVAGDPVLVEDLLAVRKHAGMLVPGPVQAAMAAALSDESHVDVQRSVYDARRAVLRAAVTAAGFTVDHSDAGLYLWVTRAEDSWSTLDWFAARGVLVAPGALYGPAGERHVRVALTASDEHVAAAADRLRP